MRRDAGLKAHIPVFRHIIQAHGHSAVIPVFRYIIQAHGLSAVAVEKRLDVGLKGSTVPHPGV